MCGEMWRDAGLSGRIRWNELPRYQTNISFKLKDFLFFLKYWRKSGLIDAAVIISKWSFRFHEIKNIMYFTVLYMYFIVLYMYFSVLYMVDWQVDNGTLNPIIRLTKRKISLFFCFKGSDRQWMVVELRM